MGQTRQGLVARQRRNGTDKTGIGSKTETEWDRQDRQRRTETVTDDKLRQTARRKQRRQGQTTTQRRTKTKS